jgi:HD superfamily phosphohydrolase
MRCIYDMCHGYISYNDQETVFLDNHWVKRLKRIKQLGLLEHVFPSASHSRFEHSLGVSHIADNYVDVLLKNSNKVPYYHNDYKFCAKMAGLFHDLGHGPFSHVFDNVVIQDPENTHEIRSRRIVEYIFQEVGTKSGFNSAYIIDYIKEMIEPISNEYSSIPFFDIVNNSKTSIDVDKFDYLQRDPRHIGLDIKFDPARIINKSYIEDDSIIYSNSVTNNILNMFSTRYRLHKDIYNHKTVKLIELMLGDSLLEADKHFNFKDISKGRDFCQLDDSIYSTILNSDNKDLAKSANILKRIENRELYKQLWCGNFDDDSHIKDFIEDNHKDLLPENVKFIHMKYNHCNGDESPLKNVKFKTSAIQSGSRTNITSFEEKTVLIYNVSNTT